MRVVKYGLIVLAVLIVGAVIAVMTMDFGAFKGRAEQAAQDATGRKLSIDGDLHLSLLPAPSLVAEKVRFANAPWGSAPDMVKVAKVEARVALMPLLSRQIVVERLVLLSPEILIETDRNGRGNWEFEAPKPAAPAAQTDKPSAPGAGGTPSMPVLDDVTIEKGLLTSRDGKTGKKTTLALDKLNVKGAGAGVPLKLDFAGSYDGNKFEVAGTLGSLADLSGAKPWPVDLKARAGGADVTVKGSVAKPMEAKGVDLALSAEGKDLTELGKLAGAALPALGAYKVAAQLSGPGNEGWLIKNLNAAVGKTTVTGQATIDPERTPLRVTARLESPEIDLAALGGGASPSSEPAKSGGGGGTAKPAQKPGGDGRIFDASPLPVDGLKSIDADVSIAAKRIVQDKLVLNDAAVHIVLQRGKLVVEPLKAGIAGGTFDGKVTLDAGPAVPELAIETNAKDVDLDTLLTSLGNPGMIENVKGGLHANLRGRGKSVRDIMASLDGTMGIVSGPGRIGNKAVDAVGADVMKLLTFGIGGNQQGVNQLNCIAAPFTVEKGIARTDAILVDTGRVTVRGTGTANLRDEKLDLLFTPNVKDASLMSFAVVPMRVSGTLASPSVTPDATAVAKGVAGAVIGGAINPLSLLAPLVTSSATDQNPCATGAAAKGPATPAAQQKPAQPQQSPQQRARDALEDVGKGIQGIFGR